MSTDCAQDADLWKSYTILFLWKFCSYLVTLWNICIISIPDILNVFPFSLSSLTYFNFSLSSCPALTKGLRWYYIEELCGSINCRCWVSGIALKFCLPENNKVILKLSFCHYASPYTSLRALTYVLSFFLQVTHEGKLCFIQLLLIIITTAISIKVYSFIVLSGFNIQL